MKKAFYFTTAGKLRRHQNTLLWHPKGGEPRHLPIETVGELYWMAPLRLGSSVLRFLGERRIPAHTFSHYGHYRGTFLPKAYILSGTVHLQQARHILSPKKRLFIARQIVLGAIGGMLRNLSYYANRGKPLYPLLEELREWERQAQAAASLSEVMGIEGSARRAYYQAFSLILEGWTWKGRVKRPPIDPINALLSLLNSLTYAAVVG
ncbi:MAG: CRISPR-associated endonuclease Cas1, partial [Bacteroidia bacterium]|nr:CRISPR-associated endonuclease Cas1 [Bacteroidia bacterium]